MTSTKADILRVPDACINARNGKLVPLLRVEQGLPGYGDQHEPAADKGEAQQVEGSGMRVGLLAEQRLQQVPGIMREPIHAGVFGL